MFIFYGSAGFLWAFVWNAIGSANPETSPFVSSEELSFILANRQIKMEEKDKEEAEMEMNGGGEEDRDGLINNKRHASKTKARFF